MNKLGDHGATGTQEITPGKSPKKQYEPPKLAILDVGNTNASGSKTTIGSEGSLSTFGPS